MKSSKTWRSPSLKTGRSRAPRAPSLRRYGRVPLGLSGSRHGGRDAPAVSQEGASPSAPRAAVAGLSVEGFNQEMVCVYICIYIYVYIYVVHILCIYILSDLD